MKVFFFFWGGGGGGRFALSSNSVCMTKLDFFLPNNNKSPIRIKRDKA